MMNNIVLIGRLVRDPELRYTSSGIPVGNFTLAVERDFKNQHGIKEVDYIKIVTWRKLAEVVAAHLNKGRLVAVSGSLQINKSQDKEGRSYINPKVSADKVQFLDRGSKDNEHKQAGSNAESGFDTVDEDLNDIIF